MNWTSAQSSWLSTVFADTTMRARSQFHKFEPRAVVIVRLQYECRPSVTGTDRASRLAAGLDHLPGIKLVGAVRALLSLLSASRV